MRILVTGGAGFIGSTIVEKLIEKNHTVCIVDNFSTGKKSNVHEQARVYECDIRDHDALAEIFLQEKPDVVFHLAANALLRKSIEDPLYDATVNILGTISVLECCRKNNVKKLIYTSTGGARVGNPVYLPVDEKHPINPISPYGISKHSVEHYVEYYGQMYGIEYFIFCFGNVYGPKDNSETKRLIPLFIDKILKNEAPKIFGDGNQTRDFIHVIDLADFIVDSLDMIGKTEHRLFHLANGKQISINEVCVILKKVSGKDIVFEHIDAVSGEVRDIVLDISLAQKELHWNPKRDIETGIRETWEWFKQEEKKTV